MEELNLGGGDAAEEWRVDVKLDMQVNKVVTNILFDERPLGLNSLFRFQLGSNAFDGYDFAKEAWKRVVGEGGAQIGGDQSLATLKKSKDTVKRELKLFEIHFQKFYGRPPSRLDKECLRMLYEYHKQLKAYISAEEIKVERQQAGSSGSGHVSGVSGSIVAVPPRPDILSAPQTPPSPSGGSGAGVAGSSSSGRIAREQIQEMDIKVLKAEKRALKIKLRRFEDDFVRRNGHKPQSYQEVGAVREDYSRYKFLKEAVGSSN